MITPYIVLPQLEACLPEIREALYRGIDFANDIQPDPRRRDPWYWSHSARFRARKALEVVSDSGSDWELIAGVANSGIHLRLNGLHVMRVLRSTAGSTPAPGHSRRRRQAWQQSRQMQFPLDGGAEGIPPVDLILDWTTDDEDELVMHLGMPLGVWEHGNHPILAWRVPLSSLDDVSGLVFKASDDLDVPVRLRIDDTEMDAL